MEKPGPLPLEYASLPPPRPRRPLSLLAIAASAVIAGALVGATTNAVNGAVSSTYFVRVMNWEDVPNVWLASIVQGILEGSVVGLLFSAFVTITIGIVTRATCTYRHGLRWLWYITLGVYATWIFGGICGVVLASWSPSLFADLFFGGPYYGRGELLRFAWVGGSIWGAEPGGLLVVIIALVFFRIHWRRMLSRESGRVS